MNVVLSGLANRQQDLRTFVDDAASVAHTTSDHRVGLGQAIARLPALLAVLRPSLSSLDRAVAAGTPLLTRLRTAAPELITTTKIFPPFLTSGTPAVESLGAAASTGRAAIPAVLPVVKDFDSASIRAKPFSSNLDNCSSTRGFRRVEGMLSLIYGLAASSAGYDQVSHVTTAFFDVLPQCLADQTALGCSGMY